MYDFLIANKEIIEILSNIATIKGIIGVGVAVIYHIATKQDLKYRAFIMKLEKQIEMCEYLQSQRDNEAFSDLKFEYFESAINKIKSILVDVNLSGKVTRKHKKAFKQNAKTLETSIEQINKYEKYEEIKRQIYDAMHNKKLN